MILKIQKSNVDIAWKLYNYLNMWEGKLFGAKSSGNAVCIFILTVVALYGELTLSGITKKVNITFKEMYRYLDSLVRYHKYLVLEKDVYTVSKDLLKSVADSDIAIPKVNEQVFCTVLNNMKYHTQILEEHLALKEEISKFKMMRALLSPVISNPIHASDCSKLSKLGYMKYRPQKKEFLLNEFAYKKDWVGTDVI